MSVDHQSFRDTIERILNDTLSAADIEAAERRVLPARLYAALEENGIATMLAPESRGGIDASLAEAMTILRCCGAAAAPGPLLETMLGRALLARAGIALPNGLLTLAFAEGAAPEAGATRWHPPRLDDVPWGGIADHLVAICPAGAGSRLALSATADWSVTAFADAAGEPRDRFSAASVPVITGALAASADDILLQASILRAGQILGAVEWALRRSVEYAMERVQFGREIGRLQAVQQMLADLADHVLAATGIVEAAADAGSMILAAAARSRLADAADAAIAIAHQVHGAIGFSREYPLNQRTRRLMAWRNDYGSVARWRHMLGSRFVASNRESLWPAIVDAGPGAKLEGSRCPS